MGYVETARARGARLDDYDWQTLQILDEHGWMVHEARPHAGHGHHIAKVGPRARIDHVGRGLTVHQRGSREATSRSMAGTASADTPRYWDTSVVLMRPFLDACSSRPGNTTP
jgi:hypothetical protein